MSETPETAMNPRDVPAELVDMAGRVPIGVAIRRSERAVILAAVLPAYRAMVIAEITEEIR